MIDDGAAADGMADTSHMHGIGKSYAHPSCAALVYSGIWLVHMM